MRARPEAVRKMLPGIAWFFARAWRYQRVHRDHRSFLRDEQGLLNGPGMSRRWDEVRYPTGEAHEEATEGLRRRPQLWHEELPLAAK
jgi:hypothetical protein